MRTNLRGILFALLLTVTMAVPVMGARAFDINDLLGRDNGIDITIERTQVGLDGYYTKECKVKANEVLNLFKTGYLKQIIADTIKTFTQSAVQYAAQITVCVGASAQILGSGGGGAINCPTDIGGEMSSTLKRNFMDQVEQRFIASCTANEMRVQIGDDVRRVIQENGPDGGPAYVTDWVENIYTGEDKRAIRRFCAQLANTAVCPYMAQDVAAYFGEVYGCPLSYFQNPPSLVGLNAAVDGGESFISRAQCTMPEGFDPSMLNSDFVANGGFDMLNRYMRPENNFENFVSMAEEELSIQRATLVRAAESEAIAGGGFRSSYGDAESSCINRDTYGKCLAYGPIRQPAGALRDANSAVFKSELDWIVNSKDSQDQLIGDVRLRAVSMIMDMQARALSYDVEAGAGTRQYADVGSGTKSPDDPAFPLPSSSPGSDPLCTGGDPRCTCVRNDPNFASLRDMVGEATATATLQHPELVQPAGCAGNECSVIPGQEVTFLHAICETVQGDFVLNCHPNAGSVDEIVVDLGNVTISVDVILGGSNRVRVPGQTVAACQAGVQ